MSDGQIMDRFVEKRDEAAFAALVRRHGPMVWGVCQRIAGRTADAEDAFQAAFLVLVRKAAAIEPREAVGNWLYGVACHTALKARTACLKLHAKEKQVANMPEPAHHLRDDREELQAMLDRELSALPDKYRLPVVLCHLEGRTRKAVAAQLKIPEGTLSSRLATAHRMLAKRLARHGLAVSGGSLAAFFAQSAASASVPASVVSSTIKTAMLVAASNGVAAGIVSSKVVALTEGVLKAMLLTQLKIIAFLMGTLCVLGTGAGVLTRHALAAGRQEAKKEPAPNPEATAPKTSAVKPKEDKEMLEGTWHMVEVSVGGKHQARETSKDQIWAFTDGKVVIEYTDGSSQVMMYQIDDAKQKPRAIDLVPVAWPDKGSTFKGIYELDGDRLKLYYSRNVAPDAERPARFDPEFEDRGKRSFVLKRVPQKGEVDDAKKEIDPKILANLAIQLRSKDWEEKSAAVVAVAELLAVTKGGNADFAVIVEPLFINAGWGGEARETALSAEDSLVRIGRQATPYLRERLKAADAHDRRVATELLVRIGPPNAALEVLLRSLLTDPDHYVRKAAIEGLATVGTPSKETVDDLERVATNDPNLARRVGARIALIRVAGASEERVRALAAFLEMKDERNETGKEAAMYAASALGDMGPKAKAAVAQLLVALKNPELQNNAAHALGQIGAHSPEAVAVLLDVLKNAPEKEARRSAAGALGAFGPAAKEAIPRSTRGAAR